MLPVVLAAVVLPVAARGQAPTANQPAAPSGGANAPLSNSGFATGPSQEVANPQIGALFGAPFSDQHLFGDWAGARTWLSDRGVQVDLDWLTENAGNVSGGRRETFTFSGQVGFETDIDLGKLAGLTNAAFHSMIVNGNGRNLSADALGDDLGTVQEIYGGRGNVIAHLVYAYGEQVLAHNKVDLVGGWLPVGTYFASSPLYCDFMNVLTCGNPHPLPNYPGEADWPQASFGGLVRVVPTPYLYAMAGVFSVDTNFGTGGGGISGWAWADPNKSGVSIPLEFGFVPLVGKSGLIGHYKIGFDHDTHSYANVTNSLTPNLAPQGHNRNDEYVLVDQMLLRQGKADTDGVIVFGGYVHATAEVSPLAQQAFAGITSTGAAWHRPGDTLGVVWHWIEMSAAFTTAQEATQALGSSVELPPVDGFGPAYGPQNTEQVVELQYAAGLYRGVTLMPDFQYIIRPGATSLTRNAAVLGFRTNVNF